MRGWLALLLAVLGGVLGLATDNSIMERCALALAALLVFSLIYWLTLSRHMEGARQVVAAVIPWGGTLTQQLTLSNLSWLPLPAARVIDHATLPNYPRGYVAALAGRRSMTWEVIIPCQTRGRYTLGPVVVSASDPLRLFPWAREVERGTSVLVLPRWVLLSRCYFTLDGALPGEQRGLQRGEAPPAIAGIRAYHPGDTMYKIHWQASARAGTLLTKQFDPEVQTTIWLALDLAGDLPYETEELLVTAATSVGMYLLQQSHVRVGLVASGSYPANVLPERGKGQPRRLQETLAEVHCGKKASLIEQFAQLNRHLGAKQVVFLFTAQPAPAWTSWLEQLRQRMVCRVIAVAAEKQPASEAEWAVPAVLLPVALADPLLGEELVTFLEDGGQEEGSTTAGRASKKPAF